MCRTGVDDGWEEWGGGDAEVMVGVMQMAMPMRDVDAWAGFSPSVHDV